MKIQPTVLKETRKVAIGTALLSTLMVLCFLAAKQFDWTVPLGALWGTLAAVGNFFLLCLSVQRAAETMSTAQMEPYSQEDEQTDETSKQAVETVPEMQQAQRHMKISYRLRMLLTGVAAIIGVVVPCFHAIAALLPLLFPQFVIIIINFIQTHKGRNA